jgi:hypothetical protein
MATISSVTLSTGTCPDPLRAFTAPVLRSQRDREAEDGALTGWTALRTADYDLRPATADEETTAGFLAAVAAEVLLAVDGDLGDIEDALLLDPVSLAALQEGDPGSDLRDLLDQLVALLQLDAYGCLIVTDLDPLRGGDDGEDEDEDRDGDTSALEAALEDAGFTTESEDRDVWWLITAAAQPE